MGKSNKSLYKQICATRRKTWGRDRKKIEREAALYIQTLEKEALEENGVQDDDSEEIQVTSDISKDDSEIEEDWEDVEGGINQADEEVEPTEERSTDTQKTHKLIVVGGTEKRAQFLTLMQVNKNSQLVLASSK